MSRWGDLASVHNQSLQEQGDLSVEAIDAVHVLEFGAADITLAGGRTEANLHMGPTLTSGVTATSYKSTQKTSEG